MRASVQAGFLGFTRAFEGDLPFMYLDVKGLVTIGFGDLVDSQNAVRFLPFRHKRDGTPATQWEIANEWLKVKNAQSMMRLGGGAFAALTGLYLDDAGIQGVVAGRLALDEATLRRRFPAYDSWPADAQLGTLSCAWAAGAGWACPKFTAAVNALEPGFQVAAGPVPGASGDLDPGARGEAWLEDNHKPGPNPANPGLHPRNLANQVLFGNAARIVESPGTYDPERLYWPQHLTLTPAGP